MCWLGDPSEGSGFSRHRAAAEAVSPPVWQGCCARQNVSRERPSGIHRSSPKRACSMIHRLSAAKQLGSLARRCPATSAARGVRGRTPPPPAPAAPLVSHASADNRSPPGGRGVERIAPPETVQWGDSLQSTRPEWGESPHSAENPILLFQLFLFAELRNCRGNDGFFGGV